MTIIIGGLMTLFWIFIILLYVGANIAQNLIKVKMMGVFFYDARDIELAIESMIDEMDGEITKKEFVKGCKLIANNYKHFT